MEKEKHYGLKIVGYILLGLVIIGAVIGIVYIIILASIPHTAAIVQFFIVYIH